MPLTLQNSNSNVTYHLKFIFKNWKWYRWTGGLSISAFFMLYGGLFEGGCGYPCFQSRKQIHTNFSKALQEKNLHSLPYAYIHSIMYCFIEVCGIKFGHKVASQLLHIRQIQTCWICKKFVNKYPYFKKDAMRQALMILGSAEYSTKKNNIENVQCSVHL